MSNIGKGFVKALVILGVLGLAFYYISYRVWLSKGVGNVDITYREEGSSDTKEDLEKIPYKDIYEKVSFETLEANFGEEFSDIYYQGRNFTSEYYIYTAIINLLKDNFVTNCNYETVIPSDEVEFKIKELFNTPIYELKSFKTKNGLLSITYNASNKTFGVKISNCSGYNFDNGGIKVEFYNKEFAGNYLYVYEKAYYIDHSKDASGAMTFNYHSGPSSEYPVIANSYEKLKKEQVATFRYSFIRENGKYYLTGINRI